jgi:signal peptidase II
LIRRYLLPVAIACSIVALDIVTKRYAATAFSDGDVVVIPGFLSFTYVENPGAAFSLFQNFGQVLGVAAIVVSVVILWALRRERPMLETVAFGLIIGGALGNLIDRMTRGEGFLDGSVVDWVNLWWIPTFNVADASVTVAVGLLLIQTWLKREPS